MLVEEELEEGPGLIVGLWWGADDSRGIFQGINPLTHFFGTDEHVVIAYVAHSGQTIVFVVAVVAFTEEGR